MIRTDATYQALKAMQTVKQVGGDFRDVNMEVHGMWDKNAGTLERLGGKLTTSVGTASVWSINQLRFRDSNAIVNRCGSTFLGHYDSPRYPAPAKFELPPWATPPDVPPYDPPLPDQNDPPILPVNPQPDNTKQKDLPAAQKQEKEPAKPGPYEPTTTFASTNLDIVVSPDELTFDANLGTDMPSVQGMQVSIVNIDTGDPATNLPLLTLESQGALPPDMILQPDGRGEQAMFGLFGSNRNSDVIDAWEQSYPPPFAVGTNEYKLRYFLRDVYTGVRIKNISGSDLSTGFKIITIKTDDIISVTPNPIEVTCYNDGMSYPFTHIVHNLTANPHMVDQSVDTGPATSGSGFNGADVIAGSGNLNVDAMLAFDGVAAGDYNGSVTYTAYAEDFFGTIVQVLVVPIIIHVLDIPAGSVIVTASNWPGITVGTIFKKSVNTNLAFNPVVDCWYPGGGSIDVNAVSPVIYGWEPFLVRDWASGVGDYGYRIPQNFTKPPVGTFNGQASSAPSLDATFAAYP